MTPSSAQPDTAGPAEADLAAGADGADPDAGEADGADDFRVVAPRRPAEQALDERSRQILAFERRWWRYAGAKEQAIRDTFGLSATRYYQLLNALLDEPAALVHDPLLVGRLRRLRARRTGPRPR